MNNKISRNNFSSQALKINSSNNESNDSQKILYDALKQSNSLLKSAVEVMRGLMSQAIQESNHMEDLMDKQSKLPSQDSTEALKLKTEIEKSKLRISMLRNQINTGVGNCQTIWNSFTNFCDRIGR